MLKCRRVLVCAPRMPEFDREGGSRRVFHLIQFLLGAGYLVTFVADNAQGSEIYMRTLQQMGVEVYAGPVTPFAGAEYLADLGELVTVKRFDLAIIAFWTLAANYIPILRALSPDTKIVIDSIDLHFLRESRSAFLAAGTRGSALTQEYGSEMARELNTYAAADAVLTVSNKEAELIDDLLARPGHSLTVPQADTIASSPITLSDRRGMVFVGNFRHPPNTQSVEYLCQEILPLVPGDLRRVHTLSVVGTEPNERVRSAVMATEGAVLVGWVPSVVPYLHHARISLVPLLTGAGTKTKLIQALAAGTPSVSTPLGIEGLEVETDQEVLVASTAADFASCITRLLEHDALWERVASNGMCWAERNHGIAVVRDRFLSVVDSVLSGTAETAARPWALDRSLP